MTFKEQIEQYLSSLPSKWRDQLVAILCKLKEEQSTVDCNTVKDCETLTVLSDFEQDGTTISIKYTDEHGIQVTRSFDVGNLINSTLDELDPNCLATPTEWNTMTYAERLQALIDSHCACCGFTDTNYTNSAVALGCRFISSLEVIPDNSETFQHYIKFVGQTGQDNVYVEIPVVTNDNENYYIAASGTLPIPKSMSGSYKAIFYFMPGQDYPSMQLFNSSNVDIGGGQLTSGNIPSTPSTAFNISQLDHITFSCENSG